MSEHVAFARTIQVRGTHYQMGLQHAHQVKDLLPAIQAAITARYNQLEQDGADEAFENVVDATTSLMESHDPAILAMIRGLADGFEVPFERLRHYNLVTFLRDILVTRRFLDNRGQASPEEGCSTWAATGAATTDGFTILAKNRDYSLEHLPLQLVAQAEPEQGYRYTYVTSAGSPGVFVAGFNEGGLALVDTHVSSTDVGPGLPTYALSMHILENYRTVSGALDYLRTTLRLGRNNLLLADADGAIAQFEIGNTQYAIRYPESGIVINTNHFVSSTMQPYFVETNSGKLCGNSQSRYEFLQKQLHKQYGRIDLAFAQKLMASHGGLQDSVCRHPYAGENTSTISSMLLSPTQRQMHFFHGEPCNSTCVVYGYP